MNEKTEDRLRLNLVVEKIFTCKIQERSFVTFVFVFLPLFVVIFFFLLSFFL